MIRIKSGVDIRGLRNEALLGIMIAASVFADHGADCVITSVSEGVHSKTSWHYAGFAFDVRSFHVLPSAKIALLNVLRAALGGQFDVVEEDTHIHIEFEARRSGA